MIDLKVSRPGLWFPTIWIYMVPLNLEMDFWLSFNFWIGLIFVSFPLNYLVYGLNDLNDFQADQINKRKGNYLFGAKLNKEQLARLPLKITWVVLPFILYFSFIKGPVMFFLLLFMIAINLMYNFRPFRLKERPPFEILIQVGYVFTIFLSILLNDLEMVPWQTLVYLSFFAFQAHIAGEIMDIEPDLKSGKKTTATLLGRKKSKLLMLLLLIIEVYILTFWFQDYVLAGFLLIFSLWLVLDIFFFFKDQPYSLNQMKLFGIAMNISAFLSMLWILYSGRLMTPIF